MSGSAFIGYHASHEQFPPSRLLRLVQAAEAAGFSGAMCSDHLFPWSERQGESGFAWSWLGSALEATRFDFGVVNAPGQRYHPVIIAQAAATLCEMYPGRFWIAVGSGENLNEHITGGRWPKKADRNLRLQESVAIMRRLWAGETVNFSGTVTAEAARVYSRPARPPLVVGAAITPETARWIAGWADALVTVSRAPGKLAPVLEAWNEGGGSGKPAYLQVKLSWAPTEQEAFDGAWNQWRTNVMNSRIMAELRMPDQYDAAAKDVSPEAVREHIIISPDPGIHREKLREYLDMGFSRLYLHNVGRNQDAFVELFGREVLPSFR